MLESIGILNNYPAFEISWGDFTRNVEEKRFWKVLNYIPYSLVRERKEVKNHEWKGGDILYYDKWSLCICEVEKVKDYL